MAFCCIDVQGDGNFSHHAATTSLAWQQRQTDVQHLRGAIADRETTELERLMSDGCGHIFDSVAEMHAQDGFPRNHDEMNMIHQIDAHTLVLYSTSGTHSLLA